MAESGNDGVSVRASWGAEKHKDTGLGVQKNRHRGERGGRRGAGAQAQAAKQWFYKYRVRVARW
jgi:hypothetical protein